MAETAALPVTGVMDPRPGDGAYLARYAQPGDGAYLTNHNAGQHSGSSNRSRNQGRGRGRGRRAGRPNGSGQASPTGNQASNVSVPVATLPPLPSAEFAMLTIEETMTRPRGGDQDSHQGGPTRRGNANGRNLQPKTTKTTYSDRFISEGSEEPSRRAAGSQRAMQNRQRRQQRSAQGQQANLEESLALGLGTVDGVSSPTGGPTGPRDSIITELNPSTPSSRPSRPHSPSSQHPSADEGAQEGARNKKTRGRKRGGKAVKEASAAKEELAAPVKSSRRAAFERGSKLTTGEASTKTKAVPKNDLVPHEPSAREPDDLNSRLTRGLRDRPYIECPICFNSILPHHQTWSCLPPHNSPQIPVTLDETEKDKFVSSYYSACYTPFHVSCIRNWASRSLNEDRRIHPNVTGEPTWRCPGCQKHRTSQIGLYRCFCGRLGNPATNPAMPHSCGDACARPRSNCDHPCPLNCHPGPCPPCQVALVVRCPSHGSALTVKCATASTNDAALTPVCDEPCPGRRSCGKHTCDRLCHFGPCPPCEEVETVRCYCGMEEKVVPCGWNPDAKKMCAASKEESWIGRFACEQKCEKLYECGIHKCEEKCHPHAISPLPCPTSPTVITTCPCGATPLSKLPGYPRKDCLARIPTCGNPCPKLRPCGHKCPLKCHDGACPPCHAQISRPCRCGESTLLLDCDEVRERNEAGDGGEFLCERVCKALRNCGRHECGRVCCPLSYLAKRSKARRALEALDGNEDHDLHVCALTCGKLLSCGIHTCPKPDHKGACGRCLQASYDELICNCGNTVIYPPVACGTKIHCVFPCARPDPSCGHPKIPHNCHEESECPPCPFLTTKPCACGKDPAVKNVRCSQTQDRVSCGQVCGKLLSCGYHRCEKTCHPGACDSCAQICNKPKRICKHACTAVCHAPAKCPETEGCSAIVTQTCACGHLQQRASCGACTANPSSRESVQLKCNSECLVRQRNARLADALGIRQPVDRTLTEWPQNLRDFAVTNSQFVKMVEQTFRDFFQGARQTLILPHMPPAKRTFVMSLADMYNLGHELIDQEPHRSVQIRRRVDSRLPNPLLSAAAPPAASRATLGSLSNLRAAAPLPGNAWGSGRLSTGGSGASTPPAAAANSSWSLSNPASRISSPLPSVRQTPVTSPKLSPAPVVHSAPVNVGSSSAGPSMATATVIVEPAAVDNDDSWDKDV